MDVGGVVLLGSWSVHRTNGTTDTHAPVAILVREATDEQLALPVHQQTAHSLVQHTLHGVDAGTRIVRSERRHPDTSLLKPLLRGDTLPRVPLVGWVDGRNHVVLGVLLPKQRYQHPVEEVLEAK